jgi:hypothetical protein
VDLFLVEPLGEVPDEAGEEVVMGTPLDQGASEELVKAYSSSQDFENT